MKFNFVQKKGVVVALATALAVGSFGITALAGVNFLPVANGSAQSVWFQNNSQSNGKLVDGQSVIEGISLTPGSPSVEVTADMYARNNQSTGWSLVRVSGSTCISATNWVITATDNGSAVFALQKDGGPAVKTWNVTASGWSSGGSTPSYGGGGGGVAVTKPEKGTETTTDTIIKEADGSMKLVDADGKAVVNAKVTIDGKSYVSDADGKVITNAFAATPSGNQVFCGADGAIIKNKTITVNGKKYLASKSGKIVTNKIAKTSKGNLVYCTKSGTIKTNGVFKVGGKQYIAKKSGALYTNRWVTIGNTKYYCNKNGVVTKIKPLKK